MDFRGKRVTVVGLARSGVAATELLLREGAVVSVTDRQPAVDLSAWTTRFPPGTVRWFLGGHPDEAFRGADLIVLSPGVPTTIVDSRRCPGVPIWSEVELASRRLTAPLVAITGSNGKSTTTALVGAILSAAGRRTFVGGNYGIPLSEATRAGAEWGEIVAEISSFQLETIETFRPSVAAVLNVTPDHLDRYRDFGAYAAAKRRIFEQQEADDAAVFNADDPVCGDPAFESGIRARRVVFSRLKALDREGVWVENGTIVYQLPLGRGVIGPVSRVRIAGAHNLENALAASAIALLRGVQPDLIARVLADFPGLEHRFEFVREVCGVTYVNDSKGTNVGAVQKSLEGCARPVVLIAGGLDKGADFTPLRPVIARHVKLLVLIGQARPLMRKALDGTAPIVEADGLEEAIRIAADRAVSGDLVVLSPACASFDLFRDFEDRGRQFKAMVEKL